MIPPTYFLELIHRALKYNANFFRNGSPSEEQAFFLIFSIKLTKSGAYSQYIKSHKSLQTLTNIKHEESLRASTEKRARCTREGVEEY